MKRGTTIRGGSIAIAGMLAVALHGTALAKNAYPVEQWAMRHVVDNVTVSPNGKRLALLKIPTRSGNPVVEVYDAADLDKEPFRVDANPMEFQRFFWLNDDHILFGARQAVRDKIGGFNRGIYRSKWGLLDLEKKKIKPFGTLGGAVLASLLPKEPDKVLLGIPPQGASKESAFATRVRALRPLDYYEYDLKAGTRKLIVQGKEAFGGYTFDGNGALRFAAGANRRTDELLWYWRTPEGKWEEFFRMPIGEWEFSPFFVQGMDDTKPHHVYVRARNGNDKLGLWSYDLKNKRFAELIYQRSDVDVAGVRYHSNPWEHPDKVVGVVYQTDKTYTEYFDEEEGAIWRQLEAAIPHAHNVRISSRSRDGRTLVVQNSGPRDPGTFYMLREGKIAPVGSRQPLFDSEKLADVEYHSYRARDGLPVAAYVTRPAGKPPHPLVVLPHGGPFARDGTSYDKWAQLLANYGYLVIQPQFRGSTGFGETSYRAAFAEGGQQGLKMQDDKDDAALYLVEKGLADRQRMAMFGWSYGGYAAAVAASRTPQLYQCVIAGAAVFDPIMQINYQRWDLHEAVRERAVLMDETGIDPTKEVAKVNVPMLIIHGDVDQRVPVDHARKYRKLLDQHKKPYKYLELKMADHFYNTLFHDHQSEFFSAMIDFLANDCGLAGA